MSIKDKLLELAQKGFATIVALKDSGADITTAAVALNNVFKDPSKVTEANMDEAHKILLGELEKFNVELED